MNKLKRNKNNMKKTKRPGNQKRKTVACYAFYHDPKQLKQIEKEIIEPIRQAFKTGRLTWPDVLPVKEC